ncbi:hypothetical protein QUB05_14795 [Microcoleus sp. F10-C6]|uniref:hypothetical protein n=1 Tax=unclassified Microcoleus TaxID=2642155 RepID=UPI002FD52389
MPFTYPKIIVRAIECNDRPVGRWRTRQCRFPTPKLSSGRSDITIARWGDGGDGSAVSLPLNYRQGDRLSPSPGGAMEDTAVPFPYHKIIVRSDITIARWGDGGHGSAVSLPQNYRQIECNDRPVGRWRTRQCRFPTTKLSSDRM